MFLNTCHVPMAGSNKLITCSAGDLDPYQARMFLTAGTLGSFYGCSNLEKDLRWGYVTSDLDIYPGQSGSAVSAEGAGMRAYIFF